MFTSARLLNATAAESGVPAYRLFDPSVRNYGGPGVNSRDGGRNLVTRVPKSQLKLAVVFQADCCSGTEMGTTDMSQLLSARALPMAALEAAMAVTPAVCPITMSRRAMRNLGRETLSASRCLL